ncbi:MAG: V-type ATPase 116kDa subunit family protein [Thermoproteus sp.]
MPFERLLFVRFAAPPDIILEVIYRLGLAGVAVIEDRPPYFSSPPPSSLERDIEALGGYLNRLGLIDMEPRPPGILRLSDALKKSLNALSICTAGYQPDDLIKREAVKRSVVRCLAERGLDVKEVVGIYRAAQDVVNTYRKCAYSEGPDTGRTIGAMAAEISAKEEELRKMGLLYAFLERLERQGYSAIKMPEGYRLVLNATGSIREPHQIFELDGFKVALIAGGSDTYGGVEVPREYLLDVATSRALLGQTVESIRSSVERLKALYANINDVYRNYSAFGDYRWEEHSGVATIAFYIREKDSDRLEGLLTDVLGKIYIPRKYISYKISSSYKFIRIPISERWPYPIQAFTKILYMYGVPEPGEISPLPLVAFLFPLFYGWMFGDIGYGMLLVLLSLVLMKTGRRDWGVIWLTAAISTTAFGLYYGDFFGLKLWGVRPELEYMTGIAAALLFGYYLIALAFILKIAQAFMSGDKYIALILYIPITILYLSIGSILLRYINIQMYLYGRPGLCQLATACGVLSMPHVAATGALWLVGGIVATVAKYGVAYLRDIGGEVIFMVIEAFIAATANILSFARLAIIYIAHGIFASVTAILLSFPLGIVPYIFTQILIAAFEGFLTAIQSLRLIYYETLSKFYKGSGRLFEPYKLAIEA